MMKENILLMRVVYLFITSFILFSYSSSASRHKNILSKTNCFNDFNEKVADFSTDELIGFARTFKKNDLKCLYKHSLHLGQPNRNFFIPNDKQIANNEMLVLFGKNSLPLLNTFEKHIFTLQKFRYGAAKYHIYGYNYHQRMRFTGPGFFEIDFKKKSTLIDFSKKFKKKITRFDLKSFRNARVKKAKNNTFNIFFGGNTKDHCHRLLVDRRGQDLAIVCQGYRTFFPGVRPAFIWDILIRKP